MSRPRTREDAAKQAEDRVVSTGIGMREWLAALPMGSGRTAVAAFDTRMSKPPCSAPPLVERTSGYAASASGESPGRRASGSPSRPACWWDGEFERARRCGERCASRTGCYPAVRPRSTWPNAALYFGLVRADADRPLWTTMPFALARRDLYAAARLGLDAVLHWDGADVPASRLETRGSDPDGAGRRVPKHEAAAARRPAPAGGRRLPRRLRARRAAARVGRRPPGRTRRMPGPPRPTGGL